MRVACEQRNGAYARIYSERAYTSKGFVFIRSTLTPKDGPKVREEWAPDGRWKPNAHNVEWWVNMLDRVGWECIYIKGFVDLRRKGKRRR